MAIGNIGAISLQKIYNMKKVLSILAATVIVVSSYSQAFWEYTTYAGAFAPSPANRWTDSWANFDPQNTVYPATTVNVTSDITSNTTWTNTNVYYINNQFIYIDSTVTLTIEPGTVIRSTGNACLIVGRGAKINAQGTAAQPIVFTSAAPAGNRDYGDWGGIVFCGAAVNNLASSPGSLAEGGIGSLATMKGVHGGSNNDDSSGIFSYVRIEFAGIPLGGANSEINGLSMYSVGRKTKIDHVQVSLSGDDSFEWFGGNVDVKNIVAFHGWDDDFDTDNGYSGRVQFAFSIRDSRYADQSQSNGFESDNDAAGSARLPKTSAQFSNVTIIGPNFTGNTDTTNSLYRRGLHIRRNSTIDVYNSVFTGYPSSGGGLFLDDWRTAANYCGDTLQFCGNILAQMAPSRYYRLQTGNGEADTLCLSAGASALATLADADNNDTITTTTALLLGPTFGNSLTDYDARPLVGSPLLNHSCWAWNISFVGVEDEVEVLGLTLYPNEGFTTLVFDAKDQGDLNIAIMDMNGRVVRTMNNMQYDAGKNTFQLDINGISTGVYVVNINLNNTVKTQKLIIK